jgi:hypothetical protein
MPGHVRATLRVREHNSLADEFFAVRVFPFSPGYHCCFSVLGVRSLVKGCSAITRFYVHVLVNSAVSGVFKLLCVEQSGHTKPSEYR